MRSKKLRTQTGGTLVEGSVALMIVTWTSVLTIFFVLATVLILFYKIKLAYVSTSVAYVASQGRYWLGAERPNYTSAAATAAATNYAGSIAGGFGLGGMPGVVFDTSIDYCGVRVSAINLPILNGPLIPSAISLNDTAYVPYIKHAPVGYYGMTVNNNGAPMSGMGMYYPSYGAGAGTPPPTSTPIGAATTFAVNVTGDGSGGLVGGPTMTGTYQNADMGGPFSSYY